VLQRNTFKQQTGRSIGTYVAWLRVRKAKELLWRRGLWIAEVSEAVGFDDPGHFCKVFRELEGDWPSGYRHKLPQEDVSAQTRGARSEGEAKAARNDM
jgi:transcriptional regulator GlxA family with amidase domain